MPGHYSLAGVARGRRETEEVHGAAAARGCRPADAPPRGGAEEAGPSGRRRCAWPRGGSSRTSRDAQATPFLADGKMREAARSLWPPRRDPLRRSVSSPASPLFPSLFSFPRSIKPALDFCHSISRPISALPLFPARFPARPLDFLPARSISDTVPRMTPASSSMASRGRLRTPRQTPLSLRRTPYASWQGDGDAYHPEDAWTPSRRLGDALRTMTAICHLISKPSAHASQSSSLLGMWRLPFSVRRNHRLIIRLWN